jgi:hypothetical protein
VIAICSGTCRARERSPEEDAGTIQFQRKLQAPAKDRIRKPRWSNSRRVAGKEADELARPLEPGTCGKAEYFDCTTLTTLFLRLLGACTAVRRAVRRSECAVLRQGKKVRVGYVAPGRAKSHPSFDGQPSGFGRSCAQR